MVGAAISNSIILRADKTFDIYMESRMLNWSEGSRKIKNTNNKKFFGGKIIFCQKDIPRHTAKEVIEEFKIKVNDSIRKWYQKEKVKNFKDLDLKQNPVFGIFSKYINSPTPIFNKNEFHITLRKELIHLLIRNNLITKSYPNYRTGTEFMFFLKSILAIVDIHDYNVLDSIAIDNLKNYLFDNKIKAIEIFGIYSNNLEEKNFDDIEQLENYLNSNLELLKSSYISSSKLEIEEILVIKNITSANLKLGKIENIKFKNFIINIIVNESKEESKGETNSYQLIIEGIKEIGLLLLIPSEYKEKFETEDIRKNLFLLWEEICNKINLSTFEIIHNFELFINSIIERRDNNIKKWLENLTSSFSEIDTKSIKELKSPLKERWKLCNESCSYCYYKCVKMLGHIKEHNCGFNHICNEKCQICEIIKCNDSINCDRICKNQKSGHEGLHSCSHFHKCNKGPCYQINLKGCTEKCQLEYNHNGKCHCKSKHICNDVCIYKDCSIGCKISCILEIGHKEPHICESNDHQCIKDCSLKDKANGCINEGKCKLKLPHSEGFCKCGGEHYCKENCYLEKESRNCSIKCVLPYGHNGKHICGPLENHKCKNDCFCFGKSKGCTKICNLNYGHDGLDNCKGKHYCKNVCYYKNKARNCINDKKCTLEFNLKHICSCGAEHSCPKKCSIDNCNNICNLSFEHIEKCDCKTTHYCQKPCSLMEFSLENTCNGKCIFILGHEGDCLCQIKSENHICNKKCSSQNCTNNCTLSANHKEECLCGKCNCNLCCQFQNNSRNCKKKCIKIYHHEPPCICEEKNHLCNKICGYNKETRKEDGGCLIYCRHPAGHDELLNHYCNNSIEKHKCKNECSLKNQSSKESCYGCCNKSIRHEGPCICKNKQEEHICNKICYLKDIKGCKYNCSLPVYHNGKCLCSVGENGHLCGKKCSLFDYSRKGCNKTCVLNYNHNTNEPCYCSSKIKNHKCNKECSLKSKTRGEGCLTKCKFSAKHTGPCFCKNSQKNHICNENCSLKNYSLEESCNDKCSLNAGHEGNCICSSKKHICKEDCDYKNLSRCGCYGKCSKEPKHEGKHICKNDLNKHKCKEKCYLNSKSRDGCKELCDKIPNHNGVHLCNSNLAHICNGNCYLSYECHNGSFKYCKKQANHVDEKCDCLSQHYCNKNCLLENDSRGCKIRCSLIYNHKKLDNSDCICSIPKDKHLCSHKCELCKGEIFCEFEYGHPGDHLCNKEHICEGICQQDGFCEINTNRNITKTHITILEKNKKEIKYEEKSEQNCKRKKCQDIIPKGKKCHEGKHKCQTSIHKCGFLCKQCERRCELEFGHNSPHYCQHGHIKNASIFTDENDAQIIFQNNEYDFQNNESVNMFTCYQYCREQRRGHIHLIEITKIKEIENLNLQEHINKKNIKLRNDNIYECRCEFFWKIFLNFNFDDEFDSEQKEEFNKCPTICKLCLENNKNKYCQLDLWHEPFSISNSNNNDIFWISKEGHKFDCKHPVPCHSIFIIDKSGSMKREDLKPLLPKIRSHQNFNNRLGKLIEILDNYIKVRNKINCEDIF